MDTNHCRLNIVSKPLTTLGKDGDTASKAKAGGEQATAADAVAPQPTSEAVPSSDAVPPTSDATASAPSATDTTAKEDGAASKEDSKATAAEPDLVAPRIESDRLSALVKPLTTAISSRGFQNTLAVASHLAHLEGAKDAISASFKMSAEEASRTLIQDLDQLLASLPPAPSAAAAQAAADGAKEMEGVESTGAAASGAASAAAAAGDVSLDAVSAGKVQSPALATLASPSSAQAILLRSLRALDYLHTGK